jgi:hypothetical protein
MTSILGRIAILGILFLGLMIASPALPGSGVDAATGCTDSAYNPSGSSWISVSGQVSCSTSGYRETSIDLRKNNSWLPDDNIAHGENNGVNYLFYLDTAGGCISGTWYYHGRVISSSGGSGGDISSVDSGDVEIGC